MAFSRPSKPEEVFSSKNFYHTIKSIYIKKQYLRNNVGYCYERGNGVGKNEKKSFEYHKNAADMGFDDGICYQQIIEGCANEKNILVFHDDDDDYVEILNEKNFDQEKIKTKIKSFYTKYANMPNIEKEICKNIQKVDLKPDDLLSSGEGSLRTNQSKLYNILEKKQLIRQLTSYIPTKIELTSDKRSFIENFMLYEDARFLEVIKSEESYFHELFSFMNAVKKIWKKSSYKNRDPTINDRTYSHNFVNSLIEFVFLNTNVEMRWDGSPCQSTKFKDIQGDGPIRYPCSLTCLQSQLCITVRFH